MEAQFGELF